MGGEGVSLHSLRQRRGRTILIVDDQAAVRVRFRTVLETEGYRCEEVASGEAALARLGGQRVDVVIVGCAMPGMNGLDLLRDLSQRALSHRPPVILHAELVDEAVINEAMRVGAHGFLKDPAPESAILLAVANAIGPRT